MTSLVVTSLDWKETAVVAEKTGDSPLVAEKTGDSPLAAERIGDFPLAAGRIGDFPLAAGSYPSCSSGDAATVDWHVGKSLG